MTDPSDKPANAQSGGKTACISRFCAVMAVAALCALFAWRSQFIYTEQYQRVKSNIETYFGVLPAGLEKYTKRLFLYYLRFSNRKYVNGVYIMNDGRLVHDEVSDPPLLPEKADSVIKLHNFLQGRNIPFLFVRAPNPMRASSDMPKGFDNTVIEDTARFMSMLHGGGVNTLDLRTEMTNEFADFADVFFWGDHHWNADGALWAYGKVGAAMNRDYGFRLDEKTWDPQEYERFVYHNAFIGTASVQTFDIAEDIAVLTPKFETKLAASETPLDADAVLLASGDFVDVFTPAAKEKSRTTFEYTDLNAIAQRPFEQYVSLAAAEDKKVLLLGDSFSWPFVTYLATAVKNIDYIYLYPENEERKKIYRRLENEDYDLVLYMACDMTILLDAEIGQDRMIIE